MRFGRCRQSSAELLGTAARRRIPFSRISELLAIAYSECKKNYIVMEISVIVYFIIRVYISICQNKIYRRAKTVRKGGVEINFICITVIYVNSGSNRFKIVVRCGCRYHKLLCYRL